MPHREHVLGSTGGPSGSKASALVGAAFYALQFPQHVFTACNPKPHQSRASTEGEAQGLAADSCWAQAAAGGSLAGSGVLGRDICWDRLCLEDRGLPPTEAPCPPTAPPGLLLCCCLERGLAAASTGSGLLSTAAPHGAAVEREGRAPAWGKVGERLLGAVETWAGSSCSPQPHHVLLGTSAAGAGLWHGQC